jgi:hypothetical protein
MLGDKTDMGNYGVDAKFSALKLAIDLACSKHRLAKPLLTAMAKNDPWLAKQLKGYGVAF